MSSQRTLPKVTGTSSQELRDAGEAPGPVGPVLQAGAVGQAIAAVICAHHADAQVLDRGSYLRILVPGRCTLLRRDLELHLGRPFHFPRDLECVMPAFQGHLKMSAIEVSWSWTVTP